MNWKLKWNPFVVRSLAAFWLIGLCNNYGYVIMLSSAEDIMDTQRGKAKDNSTLYCETTVTGRHCSAKSTGAVLLADNLPSLLCKLTFPFFMHRIPFGFRHALVCLLQAGAYFVVAYSSSVTMSLIGVVLASFGAGIGEITYLALSSFYPSHVVSAWSSGTGMAGLLGSFAYASLTEPSLGGLSPKNALLVMLFVPVLFAFAYWILLIIPDEVYTPGWNPKTWIVPIHEDIKIETITLSNNSLDDNKIIQEGEEDDNNSISSTVVEEKKHERVPQRKLSLLQRLLLIGPLIHFMIPLALVYIGEYLINQGLTQLIFFSCHRGWHLTRKSQYRWYQVLYQFGVFLSRSSGSLFELPTWALYLLPIMQTTNFTFFLFEAIYWFVPNIGIIFALIVFEGLLGGAAYVHTFNKIHKMVSPDVREYSLSIATVGDSMGVCTAGFIAIPLYNYVCRQPIHGNIR